MLTQTPRDEDKGMTGSQATHAARGNRLIPDTASVAHSLILLTHADPLIDASNPAKSRGAAARVASMFAWDPITREDIEAAVRSAWARDTCDPVDADDWSPANPARGAARLWSAERNAAAGNQG